MQGEDSKPPSSWPAFTWRVVRDRKAAITLLSVVTVIYVGLRVAGYDVVPPVFAKLGISTVPRSLDISGDWKYKCTVIGEQFYEWGGTVIIRQEATAYGIQWKLFGQRFWENKADESGNKGFRTLSTPYPSETNWGVVTSEPGVRFAYRITTTEGTIEGYAYADIEGNGKPEKLLGKFYQLPPFKAVHGRMEFRRMVSGADTKWD